MKIVGLARVVLLLASVGGCGTHTSIGMLADGAGGSGAGGTGIGGTGVGGSGVADGGVGGASPVDGGCNGGPVASTDAAASAGVLGFRVGVDYYIGPENAWTTLADLGGDGKVDLVVGRSSGYPGFSVLMNRGDGSFAAPISYPAGEFVSPIAAGDLDGDGHVDLVGVGMGRDIDILFNDGHGRLGDPLVYSAGVASAAVALGDLNGDGRLDIAVANEGDGMGSGDVAVLLNVGNRNFAAVNYPAGKIPFVVAIGDLDGDCKADLVVGDGSGLVTLQSRGQGAFGVPVPYGAGTNPGAVAVGDLNGDGLADLVLGSDSGGEDRFKVLLNYGRGQFTAAMVYAGGIRLIASANTSETSIGVGDFNGDGALDVATANTCCKVAVALNDGRGVFRAPTRYETPDDVRAVAVGDLDGDGRPDLVVTFTRGVTVLLNSSLPVP